jgi:hypothetical protein
VPAGRQISASAKLSRGEIKTVDYLSVKVA